jgi:hypothetical protein
MLVFFFRTNNSLSFEFAVSKPTLFSLNVSKILLYYLLLSLNSREKELMFSR